MLSVIFWDPPRTLFWIPYIDHPITFYGLLFATGFLLAYCVGKAHFARFFQNRREKHFSAQASAYCEKLSWYVVVGLVVGARLFHVFFYDWPLYRCHLKEIFFVWKGGLSSHGGVAGAVLAALVFFLSDRKWRVPFLVMLDGMALGGLILGAFIRLGNFVNQEILGSCTALPIGVVFGHPADGSLPAMRHPVQLYEAAGYLLLLGWALCLRHCKPGRLCGMVLFSTFLFRFLIEYLKVPQEMRPTGPLLMGQMLSVPVACVGLFLLLRKGSV